MGRMLEILRQDRTEGSAGEFPHPFSTEWARTGEEIAPPAQQEAEIPFIEVGPKKWMEASPAVLATAPGAAVRESARGEVRKTQEEANEDQDDAEVPSAGIATLARRAEPKKVFLRDVRPEGPPARYAAELVALCAPDHAVSQQYRGLVETIIGRQGKAQVVLFTAARGEAGTTTALLNLAASAARLGRSVLVVDANLRRPGIAERLGLPEAPGLREVLGSAITVEQGVRGTSLPSLYAIAAGVKPATAVPRLPAEAMRALLARLRERFDLVFVDGPSWDGRPDVVALGLACDAVYLVLPEAEAEAQEAAALCQLIPEQGAWLAGCILSRY